MRVLVIEDNLDIQANIADYLENELTLDFAYTGKQGLTLALEHEYDVIVLDVMLPGLNGVDVCRTYKEQAPAPAPVLMLTARDTLEDKELGFLAGADDYLVKPFAMKELQLRIEALARRPRVINSLVLDFGGLTVCAGATGFEWQSQNYDLHEKELKLLTILLRAAPNIVAVPTIEFGLWGDDAPESSALRTHVYGLRKALEKAASDVVIVSHRGRGYSLELKT